MRAIVLRALLDAKGALVLKGDEWQNDPSLILETLDKRNADQREAIEWVLGDEDEYVFSFLSISLGSQQYYSGASPFAHFFISFSQSEPVAFYPEPLVPLALVGCTGTTPLGILVVGC